jgi:pyridoxine 4-dehydrogenase
VLSIKGGYNFKTGPDGTPDGIRASVGQAFKVLAGAKTIDIFELARVDPNVPIETSVQAMAELVRDGKIGGIGLSEVSAGTIRRAQAVHPIAAVEIELSLFSTEALTNGIVETCHECKTYAPCSRSGVTD